LYANAESYEAKARTDSTHLLDRYLLAKTGELVTDVTRQLDGYDVSGACASVRSYLDALTNWYVRRSRDRFWTGDRDAFDTLYTVLETLSRVVAPLAPLTAEEIWRGLTGGRSVHLSTWPSADEFRPTLPWCPQWMMSGRCAQRLCPCERPRVCGYGFRYGQ